MKQFATAITLFIITITFTQAQEVDVNKIYQSAIKDYENKAYQKSAKKFTQILDILGIKKLSDYVLFQSAYIFASSNDTDKTLQILDYLANDRLYSNIEKLQKQENFKPLYNKEEWKAIVLKIAENKKTFPFRNRQAIKTSLLEAKKILEKDNGKLWGHKIWSDSLIVIDYNNTIYSLTKLENSKTEDDTLYYKTIKPNTLSFVNTTQKFNNKEYATVLKSYLNDKSSTIYTRTISFIAI